MENDKVVFLIVKYAQWLYKLGFVDCYHWGHFIKLHLSDDLCLKVIHKKFSGNCTNQPEAGKTLNDYGILWFLV